MADEETIDAPDEEGAATEEGGKKKSKGNIKLLGGVIGLIGAGTILAVMAMPKTAKTPTFVGPAMHVFLPDADMVGNPLDDNFSRYIKFKPSCSYMAYDLAYPEARRQDPHYETILKQAMQFTISQYRIDEVMAGANRDAFAAALEDVAEPILFPVHLGMTMSPYDPDEESGLRLGDSQDREGSFRGPFYDHVLKVDAPKKTLQLDDGPEVSFTGNEYDLLVEAEDGTKLYVDVLNLDENFEGEVNVGIMGRIRRMFTGDIIAQ